MRQVSSIENHLAMGQDGLCLSEVNHGRSAQTDAGVPMLFVVPLEKLLRNDERDLWWRNAEFAPSADSGETPKD